MLLQRQPALFDPAVDCPMSTVAVVLRRRHRKTTRKAKHVPQVLPDAPDGELAACTLCESVELLSTFRGKPVCQACLQEAHEVVSRTRDQVL